MGGTLPATLRHRQSMTYSYKLRIIFLSAIMLSWFVLGTIKILHGSIDKKDLKTISSDLESYEIVRIPGSKRMIDILAFKLVGYTDKTALYLNSIENYNPIIAKFQTKKPITIIYNSKGGVTKDGYNLHIYQIDYGNETLIDYKKITSTDQHVGGILYLIGIIFGLPIIYVYRQEKTKKKLLVIE
jgi:hypothetical protein